MNQSDFITWYKRGQEVNIVTDGGFNSAGYFWINLTEKQNNKMLDLMEQQGAEPDKDGWFQLQNGLRIRRA